MNARPTRSPAAQDEPLPKPIGGLAPLEFYALRIVGKEADKWRDSVSAGQGQVVDVIVRIHGTLDVGEDQTRSKSSKPELLDVLAFSFGFLGEKTRQKLAAAIIEAFKAGNTAQKPPDPKAEMKGLALGVLDLITTREPTTARGNISGKLVVDRMPGPGERLGV